MHHVLKDRLDPYFFQFQLESESSLSLETGSDCRDSQKLTQPRCRAITRCLFDCHVYGIVETSGRVTQRVKDRLPTVPRQAASTAHSTFSGRLAAVLQLLPHMRLNLCLELPSRLTQRWGQSTAARFGGSPHQQHLLQTLL